MILSIIRSLLFLLDYERTAGTATPLIERPEAAKAHTCPKMALNFEWG